MKVSSMPTKLTCEKCGQEYYTATSLPPGEKRGYCEECKGEVRVVNTTASFEEDGN